MCSHLYFTSSVRLSLDRPVVVLLIQVVETDCTDPDVWSNVLVRVCLEAEESHTDSTPGYMSV